MEGLIQAIIQADKVAQQKLEETKEKRKHIRKDAEALKKEIDMRYQEDTEKRIQEHKAKLAKDLAEAQNMKSAEFEEALKKLHETFDTKKERWIDAIVKRCQES